MNDNLKVQEVKKKAVVSAKWLMITSVVCMACSWLTNALLGRIAPEVLGQYAIVSIFISTINTFVIVGDSAVLSNFIPKAGDDRERTNIFFSLSILTFGMYIVFGTIILFVPAISSKLIGGMTFGNRLAAVMLTGLFYMIMALVSNLLISVLEARISKIMVQLNSIILPVVLVAISFVDLQWLIENILIVVLITRAFSDAAALCIGLYWLKKNIVFSKNFRFYWPKRIRNFNFSSYAQSIFSYIYNNVDKLFLVSLGSMGQLGYYQAILSVIAVVEYVPNMIYSVTVPYFSNIIAMKETQLVRNSYEKMERYFVLFVDSIVIGLIACSQIIMRIFGEGYLDYANLLVVYLVAYSATALSRINTSLVVSLEMNRLRFINSFLQISIQIGITIALFDKLKIMSLILGKGTGVLIAQLIPMYVLAHNEKYRVKPSKPYFAGILVALLLGSVIIIFDLNIILNLAAGCIAYILFLFFIGFKVSELVSLIQIVKNNRKE